MDCRLEWLPLLVGSHRRIPSGYRPPGTRRIGLEVGKGPAHGIRRGPASSDWIVDGSQRHRHWIADSMDHQWARHYVDREQPDSDGRLYNPPRSHGAAGHSYTEAVIHFAISNPEHFLDLQVLKATRLFAPTQLSPWLWNTPTDWQRVVIVTQWCEAALVATLLGLFLCGWLWRQKGRAMSLAPLALFATLFLAINIPFNVRGAATECRLRRFCSPYVYQPDSTWSRDGVTERLRQARSKDPASQPDPGSSRSVQDDGHQTLHSHYRVRIHPRRWLFSTTTKSSPAVEDSWAPFLGMPDYREIKGDRVSSVLPRCRYGTGERRVKIVTWSKGKPIFGGVSAS